MFACFGGVLFSSKNGACEKVESSFWLFPPIFVDFQFVIESFQFRFHLLDSFGLLSVALLWCHVICSIPQLSFVILFLFSCNWSVNNDIASVPLVFSCISPTVSLLPLAISNSKRFYPRS